LVASRKMRRGHVDEAGVGHLHGDLAELAGPEGAGDDHVDGRLDRGTDHDGEGVH
jgi:hypothetical protein